VAQPLSYRIFRGLNLLSLSVKKVFFHQPEEQTKRKTIRISLAYDAFHYLWSKLRKEEGVLFNSFQQMQRFTLYFNDLSMRSCSKTNQVLVIRILSSRVLTSLRKLLGVGVGVGLGKPRLTKAYPEAYCSLNDVVISDELPDDILAHFLQKHRLTFNSNGIDFIYTVEQESLQCNVHYRKLIVTSSNIVVDCISVGAVYVQQVVPYVGAMFFFVIIMHFVLLIE
jgi:hypothetical protein